MRPVQKPRARQQTAIQPRHEESDSSSDEEDLRNNFLQQATDRRVEEQNEVTEARTQREELVEGEDRVDETEQDAVETEGAEQREEEMVESEDQQYAADEDQLEDAVEEQVELDEAEVGEEPNKQEEGAMEVESEDSDEVEVGRSKRERKPRIVLQYFKPGGDPIEHVPIDNVELLVLERPKPKPRPRLQPVTRPIPKPRPKVESQKRALENKQRHSGWKLFRKLQSQLLE